MITMITRWRTLCVQFSLWMLATLVPALGFALTSSDRLNQLGKLAIVLALTVIWSCAWPALVLALPRALAAVTLIASNLLMVTFVVISAFHLIACDQLPGLSTVYAIVDTHVAEAAEFVALIASPSAWVAALANAALVLLFGYRCWKSVRSLHAPNPTKFEVAASLVLLLALPHALWDRPKWIFNNPFTFAVYSGHEVLGYRADLMNAAHTTPPRLDTTVREPERRAVHLLVVGESLTSTHMATCGYARNTTPHIDGPSEYQRFSLCDACSPRPSTALALREIMTPAGSYRAHPFLERPNLISTLQHNTYQVYWISNQALPFDPSESMASVWATFATMRWFTNVEGYQYDGVMLPRVERALAAKGDRKVVVIHMAGSHPAYAMRYPKKFHRWESDAEVPSSIPRRKDPDFLRAPVNEYDNSVLYTDYLMGKLLELAKKHDVATVTMFSDHGQNLGETSRHLGHSGDWGPRQGFMVPVILWIGKSALFSEAQQRSLERNAKAPYQTDQLFATLLELYGIDTTDSALRNSLLSDAYRPVPRACDSMK